MRAPLTTLLLLAACTGPASSARAPYGSDPTAPLAGSAENPLARRLADPRPNLVMIYADDLGWADLGVQGARGFATPHLDRMAAEGTRFSHATVPQSVCTPSRAALMTGRYPVRMGLGVRVLFPFSTHALPLEEETVAESLARAGYASACLGKWHLGHDPEHLPTRQGFDLFEGIPYSNDMDGYRYANPPFQSPPLPYYRGESVVEQGPDQTRFTGRLTDAAVEFVRAHRHEPFHLYLAHPMPHRPLAASPAYLGGSELGLYGDVVQELDASVGRLLAELADLGLDGHTLVAFSSDNGPWHRPSSGPLRGHKNTTWEGGHRVPLVVRWPGHVPAGAVREELVSVLDWKPTCEALAGVRPMGLGMDGVDLSPLLLRGEAPPHPRELAYFQDDRLKAVRLGTWKLHDPDGFGTGDPALLFDLLQDPGETTDRSAHEPERLHELEHLARRFRRLEPTGG